MLVTNPYKGQKPSTENGVYSAEELRFMVPNPDATPLFRSDVGSDGGGKSKPQDWSEHIADGAIVSQGNSVTGERGQLSRAYMWRYELFDDIMRNICGLPESDVAIDGGTREKRVYVYPENSPPAIITKTIWHGSPDNADRLDGARVVSISEEVNRITNGGTLSGNVQFDSNTFQDGPIWVPAGSTHNAVYDFEKNGAIADLVLAAKVGAAAAAPITIPPASEAAAIKAAFEAHPDIVTVTVTDPDRADGVYTAATSKNFRVTITSPAATKIVITKTTGNRWAFIPRALGGVKGLLRAHGPFIEPNHVITYLARDLDELNAIDWDDLPDQNNQGGDGAIMKDCTRITFSMGDLWKHLYGLNGKRSATDMVAGARTVETAVTLPRSNDPDTDGRYLRDTEKGCVAGGFYLVRRALCRELGYDNRRFAYVGRNNAMGFEVEEGQDKSAFNMIRYQTPDGSPSLWWEHIQPAD